MKLKISLCGTMQIAALLFISRVKKFSYWKEIPTIQLVIKKYP